MQRAASIFLTLLIFLVGGNFAAAYNQESSASLGDLCALAVQPSSPDSLGRRSARVLPQGQREQMTYNTLGQLTALRDFNGQTITRTYDATTDQLLSIVAPTNHPSLTLNHAPARYDFTYDVLGRRTGSTVKNKLGSVLSSEGYSYDIRSQLTGYAGSTGSIGYGYDAAGNLAGTKSATPGGYDVSYDYDTQNRLTMVHRGQEGIDPAATELAAYNYDANGNLNGVGYANGVQHAYTYNALNRLTGLGIRRVDILSTSSSPVSLQGYSYTLNKNGHRTHISELSGRSISNTFDALHRLTSEAITTSSLITDHCSLGTLSYSYDSVGNRASRTTTGNAALTSLLPNQSQSFTPNDRLTTDTYDANGNTTSSSSLDSGSLGSGLLTDVYSFDNKLIRRTIPGGKTIDLTYNPDGHRLAKIIAQNGITQRLHHYLTDANNPTGYAQVIEEKDPLAAAGTQLKKVNLYGNDLISSLITDHSALITQLYYSYDGLGSVRSITNSTGDLQETYDYDAYGTLIGLAKRNTTSGLLESTDLTNLANKATSEFLYTGEQWDEDLGMYFLRARYLNTNTGRFHTQDTYEGRNGEPLTLHKYLYANGNPASYTDPSGKFSLLEMSITVHMQTQLFVAAHPILVATTSAILTTIHLISLIVDPEYRHDAYAMGPLGADVQLATKLIGRSSKLVRGVPTYISIMRGRNAYVSAVRNLASDLMALRSEGRPIKEIAIIMNDKRRELGKIFKEQTPDNLKEYIRMRNIKFYRDELGPTIEWLSVDKRKSWEEIAEGATRPGGLDIDFGRFAFE